MDLCNTVIKGAEPYSDLHVACHACRSLLLLVEEKFPPEAASKAEFKNVLKHILNGRPLHVLASEIALFIELHDQLGPFTEKVMVERPQYQEE